MQEKTKAHLYILLATILIAGSFLASQKLSGVIDSISLTLYRFVLALVILSPFIIFQKQKVLNVVKVMPRAMMVSLFYSVYFIGMFKALETTTVLNTGTIYTLVPLMTAILCIFFFKDKISFNQLIVYCLGILSTCIVVFQADINLFLTFSLNKGDIIFIIASLSMALYPIFLKLMYKKDDDLLVLVFATLLGGIIWMSLTMQILGISYEWEKVEGNLLYSMIYLVIGTTILTLFLYQKSSFVLGPKKLMAYVYLSPAIVAIIIMWILWNKTIFGKNVFAVGGNPEAAAVSGVDVSITLIKIYALASAFYAVGGLLEAGRVGSATNNLGNMYEFDAIAACVVGGVSFSGGIGTIKGVVTGVIIFTVINYGLTYIGVNPYWQYIIKGLIIVSAVALDTRKYLRKK